MLVLRHCRVNQTYIPIRAQEALIILQTVQSCLYKTIKVYLAAICLYHIELNLPDRTVNNLLHLVCRGIRRLQGDNQCIRLPITINLLHTIKEQLH